jgi:hypothetical protein
MRTRAQRAHAALPMPPAPPCSRPRRPPPPALLPLLLLLLHCACRAAHADEARIVLVVPTYPPRYDLVAAGRDTWRKGVRTLVITEGPTEAPIPSPISPPNALETWWQYPNDLRPDAWKKGDQKFAASYRIANETFGDSYDWIAIGDDDTVFFMPAVRALVQGLDASIPFILSDVVSFCSPGKCKDAKTCSLPRDAPHGGASGASGNVSSSAACVRAPAVEPCTRAALEAPGVCDIPSPWYGFPFPCGRNGALISRGMMRVLNASAWRTRCEEPNTLKGGGELRVYKCLWDEGYAMTDPTPGDDPSFCAMGFTGPEDVLKTARAVVAQNGSCDAACDRILHRTVSLSVDTMGATPASVNELHAALGDAELALEGALGAALPGMLAADAASLRAELRAAGLADRPFTFTLTTGGPHARWRLFENFVAHAAPLRAPLVAFVPDAHTRARCELTLTAAARAAVAASPNAAPAAPALCFFPAATLGSFDMSPGADSWQDTFWRRVVAIAKPLSLALAASTGQDTLFAETDIVLRGDALGELRSRAAVATMTCAVASHNRSVEAASRPEGNVGIMFLRADPRLPPLLERLLVRCAPAWRHVDDQGELISALAEVKQPAGQEAVPFFDCVDASDGFSTACCGHNATAGFAVHAAGIGLTEGKITWLQQNDLWRVGDGGHAHAAAPPAR